MQWITRNDLVIYLVVLPCQMTANIFFLESDFSCAHNTIHERGENLGATIDYMLYYDPFLLTMNNLAQMSSFIIWSNWDL